MSKPQKNRKKPKVIRHEKVLKQILMLCLSLFLALLTALLPSKAYNHNSLANMQFGYPFRFITQDISTLDPPTYPRWYSLRLIQEYPTSLTLVNLVLSVLSFALALHFSPIVPKKQRALLLAGIGVIVIGALFFISNFIFVSKEIPNNQQATNFEKTSATRRKDKIPEITLEEMGYSDVTPNAIPTEEQAWLKYEFRDAELNHKANSRPEFIYSNYDLYFPEGWKLYLNQIDAFDENGSRVGDAGGADLLLINGRNRIDIKQAIYSFGICTINNTSEPLVNKIDCGQMYLDVANKNNSVEYILSSENISSGDLIDRTFLICDRTFLKKSNYPGFQDDECSLVTDFGLITMRAESQEVLDQMAEILRRIEVVQ